MLTDSICSAVFVPLVSDGELYRAEWHFNMISVYISTQVLGTKAYNAGCIQYFRSGDWLVVCQYPHCPQGQ
jgi:hypothetical protein